MYEFQFQYTNQSNNYLSPQNNSFSLHPILLKKSVLGCASILGHLYQRFQIEITKRMFVRAAKVKIN